MTTTPPSNDSPSQQGVPGVGGLLEPEGSAKPETEESEASAMLEEEDDEGSRREQDKERRSEDLAP